MENIRESIKSIFEVAYEEPYAKGDVVNFTNLEGFDDPGAWGFETQEEMAELLAHGEHDAVIVSVAVPPLASEDDGYYNIKFEDGYEAEAVSGLHLEK